MQIRHILSLWAAAQDLERQCSTFLRAYRSYRTLAVMKIGTEISFLHFRCTYVAIDFTICRMWSIHNADWPRKLRRPFSEIRHEWITSELMNGCSECAQTWHERKSASTHFRHCGVHMNAVRGTIEWRWMGKCFATCGEKRHTRGSSEMQLTAAAHFGEAKLGNQFANDTSRLNLLPPYATGELRHRERRVP